MVYDPAEDSRLLAKHVRKLAKGVVLDMGTGSGYLAATAAKKKTVTKVLGVDIDPRAIKHCKENTKDKKITFLKSNLFSKVGKKKFDTIIFNPPYLPADKGTRDIALIGGKYGWELIEAFMKDVSPYLKPDGIILLLFSSLTKKKIVEDIITNNAFAWKELDKTHVFFEDLFVYQIGKTTVLKDLEKQGVTNIQYFNKGKRGIIYTGDWKRKKIAIKAKRHESEAQGRMAIEAKYLALLNSYKIGPELLFSSDDYLAYRFVEGEIIKDWLHTASKTRIKKVFTTLFNQCFTMDELRIAKEEMHHPTKHVIIGKKDKVTMLDFERCRTVKEPKNVTQLCDFVQRSAAVLKKKGFVIKRPAWLKAAREYKKDPSKKTLKKILALL